MKISERLGGAAFIALWIAGITSAPLGLVLGVMRDSTLNAVLSLMVPFYGILYAVFGG